MIYKILLFALGTLGILWVSRAALRHHHSHGFARFFAWEAILGLFALNVERWFIDPFTPRQILSWALLVASLSMIYSGVSAFRRRGRIDPGRADPGLVGIEKTTELVTTGVYHYLRHPFYSSLLFLAWGILLKRVTGVTLLLALAATAFLFLTAKIEEGENVRFFGEKYRAYMLQTKMFVPFVL